MCSVSLSYALIFPAKQKIIHDQHFETPETALDWLDLQLPKFSWTYSATLSTSKAEAFAQETEKKVYGDSRHAPTPTGPGESTQGHLFNDSPM
ncbi:hypothetical protein NDU88_004824 [Pleurodeles waltl]|uniref:Uncharacterized protein n=1 Tax=Pleurodeles waltl TaxID=8319 RepID=A0AAV7MHN9_PLEWA|nr:hypothetical protein NDU88_004824 [Pleurodeles waltl]